MPGRDASRIRVNRRPPAKLILACPASRLPAGHRGQVNRHEPARECIRTLEFSPGCTKGKPRGGFTLVEMIVVIVIISIIIALLLTAAMGGIRTAEEKATQSLIAKLNVALSDRLEALMESRPKP